MENQITKKTGYFVTVVVFWCFFSFFLFGLVSSFIPSKIFKKTDIWIYIDMYKRAHTNTHSICGSVDDDDEMAK